MLRRRPPRVAAGFFFGLAALVGCTGSPSEPSRGEGAATRPTAKTSAAASCTPTDAAFVAHGGISLRVGPEALEMASAVPSSDSLLPIDPKSLAEELPWIKQMKAAEGTLFVTDPEGRAQLDAWLKAPSVDDIDAAFVDKAIGWTAHARVRLTPRSKAAADVVGKPWVEDVDGELLALCKELQPALPDGAQCGGGVRWLAIRRTVSDAVLIDAFDLPQLMGVEMGIAGQWPEEYAEADDDTPEPAGSDADERAYAQWASTHGEALRARVSAGLCAKPAGAAPSSAAAFVSQDDAATAAYERAAGVVASLDAVSVVSPQHRAASLNKGVEISTYAPQTVVFSRAHAEWDPATTTARVRWTVDPRALPDVSAWLKPSTAVLPALDSACESVGCLTYRGKISAESVRTLAAMTLEFGESSYRRLYPLQMMTRWPTAVAALLTEMGEPTIDGLGVVDLSSVVPGSETGEGPFALWLMTQKGGLDETAWATWTEGSTTGAVSIGSAELRWVVLADGPVPAADRWLDKHLSNAKLEPRSGPVLEYQGKGATLTADLNGNELIAELQLPKP